ncbi:cobalamin biosynthesis protein [Falsirhodobacter halotolerans]|uniref:cobalamin biosynthesis protein n=1 Tax=Falsirhodobacter halotolerans TaxID=1146892 RepID=UPI001FD5B82B|nr:cobalamin biosynthesis protein [Falsirhodobacter halotolerans]MCJ8139014.1 cobalamin biosynthesis protein [Falsirhodobacter halotolerans]
MIVAGLGFRRDVTVDDLRAALAGVHADAVATVDSKIAPLHGLGLPVIAISRAVLARQVTPTDSAASRARHCTGSVAEAAALAALGPEARLLGPRRIIDGRITLALAEGDPA